MSATAKAPAIANNTNSPILSPVVYFISANNWEFWTEATVEANGNAKAPNPEAAANTKKMV